MARIPLPLPDVPEGEACPACGRPYRVAEFGACAGEPHHHIGYTTGLIGRAVDPEDIRGPEIDEASP